MLGKANCETCVKLAAIYIAVSHGAKTADFCARFCSLWNIFPPGEDCDLIVACNGGPLPTSTAMLFAGLNAQFWPRLNSEARDIGSYIEASRTISKDYDAILCLGESVHFNRAGWLRRLVEAWQQCGPGMYGPFATHVIRSHLQTTAFMVQPKMLREYPLLVTDRKSRYEFEHGERALWRRLHARNIPVKLVTWSGVWSPGQWRLAKNGLWSGDQSDCLMLSNHTQRWAEADETRKRNWTASANRPYQ